jgi:DNA-binding helix-hairpin-helix protein with protein kinase domain
MTDLFDGTGRRIPLGKKLGAGGEGTVYDVPALGGIVAKIYHAAIHPEKQAKLRGMVKCGNDSLKQVAAWPLGTLHIGADGPLRGFLMQKVAGYEPIHHLYGPNHRKQRFPDKDWAFLINAARNTAAAFEAIHSHGHVIGDVNPNLVFVAGKSITKLIDCDSFQIMVDGKHYSCEVGVPHFTPPELQNITTFRGIRRTTNHDNFGLALLMFHLLLMGRHPYSGIYSGRGDMPLEQAIAQFRYAFGRQSVNKGMTPPPNSVTPAILPETIIELFERALTEQGTQADARPSAREWVDALDDLREKLRSCQQESTHKYFGDLTHCPWCAQEQRSGSYFFISRINATTGLSNFNLGKIWSKIIAVTPPGSAPEISTSVFQCVPQPLPIRNTRKIKALRAIAVLGVLVAILTFIPARWYLTAMGVIDFILLVIGAYIFLTDDSAERHARQEALRDAQRDYAAVQDLWQRESGDARFHAKLSELARLRAEYTSLSSRLAVKKQELQGKLYQAQLHQFLQVFPLNGQPVKGLESAHQLKLASTGIQTAADISWTTLANVDELDTRVKSSLIAWRNSLEQKFIFDPCDRLAVTELAVLELEFAHRKRQIEAGLLAAPERLNQLRQQILQQRAQMLPLVESLVREVAQAEVDLSVFK